MKRKIRVGWFSDYCFSGTGFATVGRHIMEGLAATEKYEIYHIGQGITPHSILKELKEKFEKESEQEKKDALFKSFCATNAAYASVPLAECWKIPAPSKTAYSIYPNSGDRFGRQCLIDACQHFDLDCMVVNLDPWMTSWLPIYYQNKQWRKPCPIIYYQPIDAVCLDESSPYIISPEDFSQHSKSRRVAWSQLYCLQDFTVFYGSWGQRAATEQIDREVREGDPELARQANLRYIRHGIDANIFYPVPCSLARLKLGIPDDAFVVGMVAANQPRKDWPSFLQAIAEFSKEYDNIYFMMWTNRYVYQDSYDLAKLVVDCGGRATWIRLPFLEDITPPDEYLNLAYNAMNVHLLLHRGEGCGLPHIEATAVGIPAFATAYGGIVDYFVDKRQAISPVDFRISSPNLLLRPSSDLADVLTKLRWVYTQRDEAIAWASSCAEVARKWTWDATILEWENVINEAATLKERWNSEHESERIQK